MIATKKKAMLEKLWKKPIAASIPYQLPMSSVMKSLNMFDANAKGMTRANREILASRLPRSRYAMIAVSEKRGIILFKPLHAGAIQYVFPARVTLFPAIEMGMPRNPKIADTDEAERL